MAEPLVADVAAPSAEPIDLTKLSPDERQTWREKGTLPEPKAETKIETSDAEPPEGEEAETASAPEAGKQESQPKRSNAETRIKELLAENKRLKAEASKPPETKQAEPSPAKVEAKSDELKAPVKPKETDFDTYEKFEEAKDKYSEDLADYKAEVKVRQLKAEMAQEKALEQTKAQLSDAEKKYPDWNDVAKPFIGKIADAQIHPAVMQVLNNTKNLTDVMYAIGGSKDAQNIVELAKTNPAEAIRQIAVYEYLVSQELAGDKAEPKEKVKISEPVTKAPKPVTEIGGRSTSSEDPGQAAVRASDFRSAKAEWNRKAAEGRL